MEKARCASHRAFFCVLLSCGAAGIRLVPENIKLAFGFRSISAIKVLDELSENLSFIQLSTTIRLCLRFFAISPHGLREADSCSLISYLLSQQQLTCSNEGRIQSSRS
jgi:hypothetical protein